MREDVFRAERCFPEEPWGKHSASRYRQNAGAS